MTEHIKEARVNVAKLPSTKLVWKTINNQTQSLEESWVNVFSSNSSFVPKKVKGRGSKKGKQEIKSQAQPKISELTVVFYSRSRTKKRLKLFEEGRAEKYRKKEKRLKREKIKKPKFSSRKRKQSNINRRIIWTNLNYKDEKTDLTKFRPYLVKKTPSLSKTIYSLELLTMTSQDWKEDFKYEVEVVPSCLKKASLISLNTLVHVEIKKRDLKKLFKCNCKNGCFDEIEYDSIIASQKEFQENNEIKVIKIEKETLINQIQIPPK